MSLICAVIYLHTSFIVMLFCLAVFNGTSINLLLILVCTDCHILGDVLCVNFI